MIGAAVAGNETKLDLNLMLIFDMVMTERHVSRASKRLGLTQPAVSNALNRLRSQFDDVLFVKTARGVEPTQHALALWSQVHDPLLQLHRVFMPAQFSPASATTTFRIAIADFASALLTPLLHRLMVSAAPHVALACVPHVPDLTLERLARKEVDFAMSVDSPRVSTLEARPLLTEHYVVAGRLGHPLLRMPPTLTALSRAQALNVNLSGSPDFQTPVDTAFAKLGVARPVMLTVNQFLVAIKVLCESDLLAILPSRLLIGSVSQRQLTSQPLPFSLPPTVLHLIWHRRNNGDTAMEWLRELIFEAASQMEHEQALAPSEMV